jgi:ADP-heptose:LPS heptosyltransferase
MGSYLADLRKELYRGKRSSQLLTRCLKNVETSTKNWTAEKWAETINRLIDYWIGPIDDVREPRMAKKHCEMICLQLKRSIESVSGKTSMKNYLSIIWQAKAVLTPDGSASHIAAAFKRRCITLFGHTDATHWHRETAYSQAIITGNIIGKAFPRLELLLEEPVIEAVVKLWTTHVSL